MGRGGKPGATPASLKTYSGRLLGGLQESCFTDCTRQGIGSLRGRLLLLMCEEAILELFGKGLPLLPTKYLLTSCLLK